MTRQPRWPVLVAVVVFGLGCAGLFDDGEGPTPIRVTNPDGSTQTITQGANTEIPADFPLPMPPGLTPESSILSTDGGPTTLTFRLESEAKAEEVVVFYTEWMQEQGWEFNVESTNLAGMKSTSILAKTEAANVSITVMDGMGARMLTLMLQPTQ